MYVARAQLQAAAAKLQLQGSTVQCHPQTAAAWCWFGPWITLAMHLVSFFFAWLILLATFSSTVLSSAATSLFDINSNATQHLRWRNTMLSPSHSSTTLDPSSSSLTLALRINSKTRLGGIAQNNDNNSTEWQSCTSTKANYPCQGNKLIKYLNTH